MASNGWRTGAEARQGARVLRAVSALGDPSMSAFEPESVGQNQWLCPCKDSFGSAARLVQSPNSEAVSDGYVQNYHCDQNGDRWQLVVRGDDQQWWQYLGRRTEAPR